MKTAPIRPARIDFGAGLQPGAPPRSPEFDDVYHPGVGALAQAQHVFLAGNRLPARWAGRSSFSILETGFGLGNNFLATWAAWRDDRERCRCLVFVAIEAHPPSIEDLRRAHEGSCWPALAQALAEAWPPAVPNLHLLEFEQGRVQLLLGWGDARKLLRELRGTLDAFYLDGFAPSRNPAMWELRVIKALARRAAPEATVATWSVARSLRDDLASVGFDVQRRAGIGGKREVLAATFAPRFVPKHAAIEMPKQMPSSVLVIGAGLAGAWAAWSLARRGVAVTLLDRHAEPAQETSGQIAGLFHGTLHPDDGVHARLHRAAALHVQRVLQPWFAAGLLPGAADGLLRIDGGPNALEEMRALVERQGLPGDYVQALDAEAASARAGTAIDRPAWFFATGGWVDPGALVRHLAHQPGVRFTGGCAVDRLARGAAGWAALDAKDAVLASADAVVLASAVTCEALAGAHGVAQWPLDAVRGQTSHWAATAGPRIPVAGGGYAVSLPRAAGVPGGLLCGASAHAGDWHAALRETDHEFNVQRLTRLTGLRPDPSLPWQGRVGWRLQTPDRLPVVGAVAAAAAAVGARRDQARFIARVPGLFVSTALGARGIAVGALAAELLAAQLCGTPWPLEADLADAIDPARWLVRQARRAAAARGV